MKRLLFALLATVLVAPLAMELQAQADTRPTVAVLAFNTNIIGTGAADYASLGRGVADMMITELVRNGSIRVVERERIDAIIKEQDLGSTGRMTQETAVRIGKVLGAKHMVFGDIHAAPTPRRRLPNSITIAVRTVDSETSQITNLGDRLRGNPDELMGLIQQAMEQAGRELKLPPVPAASRD